MWRWPRCLSVDEWIDKLWHIHRMEYPVIILMMTESYQGLKRYGGSLMHISKWKKPVWKDYLLYDSCYMTFWKRQDCKDSKKLVVAKGLREGERNEYVEHGILSAWKLFCVIPQWWPHDSMHLSKLIELYNTKSDQFSSVQSLSHVQLFVTALTAACQASLSITNSQSLLKCMSIESVMPPDHLILCCPPLFLPSIFPSIRVFSSESVICIRWPKYWSFNFNISPSNEYSGLISCRMDWLDLLAVQGTLKGLLQHHSSKASILWCSAFFIVQLSHPYMITGKTIADETDLCWQSNVSAF